MEANLALLKRLDEYSLDDPNSTFPFSAKLAKEKGWTKAFTQRAIQEYKRFCYLAVVAGHPVSPSEPVDEVWHMHLTYSHEYWNVFCPQVLQRKFHHYPSTGGREERAKFDDWFARTLESYRHAFGENPPDDIWNPSPEPVLIRHEMVSLDHHYVVPKGLVKGIFQGLGVAGAVMVATSVAQAASLNPLDFYGPEFLQFYVLLFVVMFAIAHITKYMLRTPATGHIGQDSYPGPYAIAYLNGKAVQAVNSAIASLIRQERLEFDPKKVKLRTADSSDTSDDPLEFAILSSAKSANGAKLSTVRTSCQATAWNYHRELQDAGLLVSRQQGNLASAASFLIGLSAPAYGLIKIFVGISRDRPVLYLEVLSVVSVVLCLFLLKPAFRSRYGDQFLSSLKASNERLSRIGYSKSTVNPMDVAMAYALFGAVSMAGSPYELHAQRLNPPLGSSSCGGGTYSGSDTSSGCGGGGDGGGGGCGGGCGGCGG